jgi:hypothetical protein
MCDSRQTKKKLWRESCSAAKIKIKIRLKKFVLFRKLAKFGF